MNGSKQAKVIGSRAGSQTLLASDSTEVWGNFTMSIGALIVLQEGFRHILEI